MLKKFLIAGAMFAGALVVANVPLASQAKAEQVYNTAERRWEEVDLSRRQHMKSMPAKYKRRGVVVATREAPGTIIIDTNNKFLYHIEGPIAPPAMAWALAVTASAGAASSMSARRRNGRPGHRLRRCGRASAPPGASCR
jgi:lipoprotein-anchoring transpeptidase ErfK/SrfK